MQKNWVLRKLISITVLIFMVTVAGYGFFFGNFRFDTQEVLAYAEGENPETELFFWSSKRNIFSPSSVVFLTSYGREVEFRVTNLFGKVSIKEVEKDLMASK